MGNATELIDRYIETWNETDSARRRALIERTWTADATYLDPLMQGSGHAGIDAMIAAVHTQYPGNRFRRISEVDVHHDRVRFAWTLGPDGGPALAQGIGFGMLADGHLLAAVTGFLDQPAPAYR
ncbi:MAG TPA: nuclear transport factor 2 family protein [Burkholderiales bacterium]